MHGDRVSRERMEVGGCRHLLKLTQPRRIEVDGIGKHQRRRVPFELLRRNQIYDPTLCLVRHPIVDSETRLLGLPHEVRRRHTRSVVLPDHGGELIEELIVLPTPQRIRDVQPECSGIFVLLSATARVQVKVQSVETRDEVCPAEGGSGAYRPSVAPSRPSRPRMSSPDAKLAAVDTRRGDFFTLIEFLKPLAVGCNPHDLQIGQVRTKYGD